MPDFNGVTPVVSNQTWSLKYVWVDGTLKTRTLPNVSPDATDAQRDIWITRSAQSSNMGLVEWQGNGKRGRINITQASILDEAHGVNTDLELQFEQEGSLRTMTYRIPAPAAERFQNGVVFIEPKTTANGGSELENLNAELVGGILNALNENVAAGSQWLYAGGYLSTAPAEAKRKIPGAGQISEPPTGTVGDDPGENPA